MTVQKTKERRLSIDWFGYFCYTLAMSAVIIQVAIVSYLDWF